MKSVKLEQLRDRIIGIKPVYTVEGNATEILLNDGTIVLDPRGLKSVHRALARLYAVDLQAQRLQVENMLHRRGTLPFYLEERVFVPLKLRRAVTDNDQVYGYVDVRYLDEPQPKENGQCRVRLKSGQELEVLSSVITAAASRHTGLRVLEVLTTESGRDPAEEQIVNTVLYIIRCLKAIHERLRCIENKV